MLHNRLGLFEEEKEVVTKKKVSVKKKKNSEAILIWERRWLKDAERLDPSQSAVGRLRIDRSWEMIKDLPLSEEAKVVDLGCGRGELVERLANKGIAVDAVDVATNAYADLQKKRHKKITFLQDALPDSSLDDRSYDLVICTDLIAELKEREFRLLFSELARLLPSEGKLLCSTPLDSSTVDPLKHFVELAATEFDFIEWKLSYHRLHQLLENFSQKKGIGFVGKFLEKKLKESGLLVKILEKVSRLIWKEGAATHAIFLGVKRKLNMGGG